MTTLNKFRTSFTNYLTDDLKMQIPTIIKSCGDMEFAVFIINNIKPYSNDWENGFLKLKEFITLHGHIVPDLNNDEKNKIIRYLQCFIDIIDS